ncbi:hypothetical protein Vadar_026498 [Vaccinium darrowii]|uniref:Uncharacterized protein n=1 Tax=Vaccinium darrowii TaxID=229202 RepID=A0ACB7XK10_9ERIC|nr:hypothetical protein Vadar_026498 [Vaccinium darrowii]
MASAAISNSLCNSSSLPRLPYPRISPHRKTTRAAANLTSTKLIVSCASRNENYGGRMVDENLIVLRKRIHEMKMAEANYEPPAHWMEWEKNCYAGKDEFVCELVGLVQTQMMNARPGLVLGLILMVALSVPTSAAVLCFQMLALIKGVLPA